MDGGAVHPVRRPAAILALDIATVLGAAFARGSDPPRYASKRMGPKGCSLGQSFVAFRDWLERVIDRLQPDVIVFEAPILTQTDNPDLVQRLMGYTAIAEEVATRRGIKSWKANGDTVTKTFAGRARFPGATRAARRAAKKRAVIETCRLFGWDPQDDNAADALAILHFAQSIFNVTGRAAGPLFADAPPAAID